MKRAISISLCILLILCLTSCEGKSVNGDTNEPQCYEGGIGDEMPTYFFNFTVNSAALTDTYSDVTLAEDTFLVASVTVKNVTEKVISMFDTDFQAQWGDDADDAYSYPITWEYEDGLLDEMRQLPQEYTLEAGKSRTGELVFIVPKGASEYSISYKELFSDTEGNASEGDVFFVFFKP